MKRLVILICLFIFSISSNLFAQDIFFPEIEPLLSAENKQDLEKAVNILLKARGNENNANDIERKYSKLKKKGKETAWMEKTWEAKQQRIMAEKNYRLAYETIASVYSNLIKIGKYASTTDKTEALSLDKEAQAKFEDADQIFAKLPEQTQEVLAQSPNKEIEKTLYDSHSLKLQAIGQQIVALEKIIGVGNKESISKTDDDLAWEKAKESNNIDGYYNYLNNNPRGIHMHEANEMITQIEKTTASTDVTVSNNNNNGVNNPNRNTDNTRKNPNNDRNKTNIAPGNFIFKVQIAAAVSEISQWMLNAKAPGTKNIEMVKAGIWYKYLAGSFNSYNEAAEFRNELRSHAPDAFIVAFSGGKPVPINESMKN